MKKFKYSKMIGPHRVEVEFIERKDMVEFSIKCHPFLKEGDIETMERYKEFLLPLLEKYDSDPRPTRMIHPISGQVLTVIGNADDSIGIITPGNFKKN